MLREALVNPFILRLLGSIAVAVDSPRRGVVGQDAKVPVIGGVRVDSVDTVEGDFLHADLRGRNGRIMSINPTTNQAPPLYYMQTPKGVGVRGTPHKGHRTHPL